MGPLSRSERIDGSRRFTLAEPTSPRARLVVKNLSVAYGGNTVVRDVSLAVQPGEAVAFLGRKGAGETTPLLGISRAGAPSAGSLRIGGPFLSEFTPPAVAPRGLAP